jgi:hypothetical protein
MSRVREPCPIREADEIGSGVFGDFLNLGFR